MTKVGRNEERTGGAELKRAAPCASASCQEGRVKRLVRRGVLLVAVVSILTLSFPSRTMAGGWLVFDSAAVVERAVGFAQEAADWVTQFEKYDSVIAMKKVYEEYTKQFMDEQSKQYDGISGATAVRGKLTADTAQAKGDAAHDTAKAQSATETVQQTAPPPDTNVELCNIIIGQQAGTVADYFADLVEKAASEALTNMYRGPGEDGTGPQYAADAYALRCPPLTGPRANDPKFGNPIDGVPPECVEKAPEPIPHSVDHQNLTDADIKASTLMDVSLAHEMPMFVEKSVKTSSGKTITIKVPTPDPELLSPESGGRGEEEYVAQQRWIAGLRFCFQLVGPRPTPPSGEERKSPQGRSAAAQYDHCLSNQTAIVTPCLKRLAKLTRPYCRDGDMSPICTPLMQACNAAQASGVQLPPGVVCDLGMSAYQAQYVGQLMCKTSQHWLSSVNTGANHGDLNGQVVDCEKSMTDWRALLEVEKANIEQAAAGLQELSKTCFVGVAAKGGRSVDRISAPRAVRPRGGDRAEATPRMIPANAKASGGRDAKEGD